MTGTQATDSVRKHLDDLVERRSGADVAFFAERATRIARLCHEMASGCPRSAS